MEECEHIAHLRHELLERGFRIWGELTERGWINIWCEFCQRTFEVKAIKPK
jgi:hypothetical protein